MEQVYLQQMSYDEMMVQLKTMPKDIINLHLKSLGCTYTYDDLKKQLESSYNELAIADSIFETQEINDKHSIVPKSFVDEVVLEITYRETYTMTHYGSISCAIEALVQSSLDADGIRNLQAQFQKLFKTAKQFHIQSLEAMMYQVNDGIDMLSALTFLLDEMMIKGREDKQYYKDIVTFVDKYLSVFSKTSDFLKVTLLYEQAQAYIALKSKKGEQLFLELLATHSDVSDVVLHYALAYLDDDERKALKIIQRYESKLDKENESYRILQDIKNDICNKK